jgi:hypothetical protein
MKNASETANGGISSSSANIGGQGCVEKEEK